MSHAIVLAPTNLGLRPSGVERLGDVLLQHGLARRLGAEVIARVEPSARYDATRDPGSALLNPRGIAAHAVALADVLGPELGRRRLLVLGGDDSVLVGTALAMRRRGRSGLVFFDAHADFCPPAASPTGELSDSDLAVVTGFGPAVLANVEGRAPYVRASDVVHLGRRDAAGALPAESASFAASGIEHLDLSAVRRAGSAQVVADHVPRASLRGRARRRPTGRPRASAPRNEPRCASAPAS